VATACPARSACCASVAERCNNIAVAAAAASSSSSKQQQQQAAAAASSSSSSSKQQQQQQQAAQPVLVDIPGPWLLGIMQALERASERCFQKATDRPGARETWGCFCIAVAGCDNCPSCCACVCVQYGATYWQTPQTNKTSLQPALAFRGA